jgi:hypothetical protein
MAKGPDEPLCCSRRAGAQGRLIVAGDNVENPMQAVLDGAAGATSRWTSHALPDPRAGASVQLADLSVAGFQGAVPASARQMNRLLHPTTNKCLLLGNVRHPAFLVKE